MKISVKFACPEILGDMKNGSYELPNGGTVEDLLKACEKECDFQVNRKHLKWLLILIDGQQANWDTTVPKESKVSFIRGAMGG